MAKDYLRALPAPATALTVIDSELVARAVEYSRESPRRRVIQPFHKSPEDPLHRMLNAVQPGSYVRPHRHLDPPKSEAWIVLAGRLVFFTFSDDGRVTTSLELGAGEDRFGVDLAPGVYHTFITLAPDTVIFEVKNGPYAADTDKAFAPWAPPEGDARVDEYVATLMALHARSPSG